MRYKCEYVRVHYVGAHPHNSDMLEVLLNERASQGWQLNYLKQVSLEHGPWWLVVLERDESRSYPRYV